MMERPLRFCMVTTFSPPREVSERATRASQRALTVLPKHRIGAQEPVKGWNV
jgi:hypothetical protein